MLAKSLVLSVDLLESGCQFEKLKSKMAKLL